MLNQGEQAGTHVRGFPPLKFYYERITPFSLFLFADHLNYINTVMKHIKLWLAVSLSIHCPPSLSPATTFLPRMFWVGWGETNPEKKKTSRISFILDFRTRQVVLGKEGTEVS